MTLDRPGALLSTRLAVLAAESADTERHRRGRTLKNGNAVLSLTTGRGVLEAQVQGSEPDPYVVTVGWKPTHRPGAVPLRAELHCRCTCADLSPVCKHAVAVLLKFADDVGARPEVLETWRGPEDSWAHLPVATPELRLVGGTGRGPREARPEREAEEESEALRVFFGARSAARHGRLDHPEIPRLVPPTRSFLADPVGAAAGRALDEAMAILERMYGAG